MIENENFPTKESGVHREFVCVCGDPATKAQKKHSADEHIKEVMQRLSQGSASLMAREITRENFLTAVVTSLNWDFMAHITRISNDQWSAVSSEKWTSAGEEKFKTYIQCDRVEDGIAATWLAYANRFPELLEEEH